MKYTPARSGKERPGKSSSRKRLPREAYDIMDDYFFNVSTWPSEPDRVELAKRLLRIAGCEHYTPAHVYSYFANKRLSLRKRFPGRDNTDAETNSRVKATGTSRPNVARTASGDIAATLDVLLSEQPNLSSEVMEIWARTLGNELTVEQILAYRFLHTRAPPEQAQPEDALAAAPHSEDLPQSPARLLERAREPSPPSALAYELAGTADESGTLHSASTPEPDLDMYLYLPESAMSTHASPPPPAGAGSSHTSPTPAPAPAPAAPAHAEIVDGNTSLDAAELAAALRAALSDTGRLSLWDRPRTIAALAQWMRDELDAFMKERESGTNTGTETEMRNAPSTST
ncbi:hypothetical protein C8Q80DRAFT_206944 [Daedaleopsis nitida]|nr:hypothetical protein C8Q80DRAFT_206944 [Daedaleopsis nitida]